MKLVQTGGMVAIAALLGACSSSGSGDLGDTTLEDASELIGRSNIADLAEVDELPSDASLSGGIYLEAEGYDESIVGRMTMEADFEEGTVTGSTSDLGLYEVSGELGANFGCLDECDAELVAELDGDLTLDGTISGNTFDSTLRGDVSGSNDEGDLAATIALDADGFFKQDDEGLLASSNVSGTAETRLTSADGSVDEENAVRGIFVVAE